MTNHSMPTCRDCIHREYHGDRWGYGGGTPAESVCLVIERGEGAEREDAEAFRAGEACSCKAFEFSEEPRPKLRVKRTFPGYRPCR